MYKPHTIEQFKVQQFLEHTFAIDHFLVSPLSRTALMLEDKDGERIAFSFSDNEVREIPIPPAADLEKVKAFIRQFHALDPKPHLRTFEEITRWWLDHPNPLTYQQALGLSDELYRRFLSHPMIDDEDAWLRPALSRRMVIVTSSSGILTATLSPVGWGRSVWTELAICTL